MEDDANSAMGLFKKEFPNIFGVLKLADTAIHIIKIVIVLILAMVVAALLVMSTSAAISPLSKHNFSSINRWGSLMTIFCGNMIYSFFFSIFAAAAFAAWATSEVPNDANLFSCIWIGTIVVFNAICAINWYTKKPILLMSMVLSKGQISFSTDIAAKKFGFSSALEAARFNCWYCDVRLNRQAYDEFYIKIEPSKEELPIFLYWKNRLENVDMDKVISLIKKIMADDKLKDYDADDYCYDQLFKEYSRYASAEEIEKALEIRYRKYREINPELTPEQMADVAVAVQNTRDKLKRIPEWVRSVNLN